MAAEPAGFPTTQLTLLRAAGATDPEHRRGALEALASVYWRPSYFHLRRKWGLEREDAEDLTQEFFARIVEQPFFESYEPDRARFRTFLRTALDRLAANHHRDARRLKRGGGAAHLPLDFAGAERDFVTEAGPGDAEAQFDQEWMRSLFTGALDALRQSTAGTERQARVALFQRYDIDPSGPEDRPSYRTLAEEYGLPVTQVTNHLAWSRREFRRLVLEQLRQLCGSEAEYRAEARELFGVRAP